MSEQACFYDADAAGDIALAVDFMAKNPLHYPRYHEWLERAREQMFSGQKHALCCRYNGLIAATLTWQTHPSEAFTAELKNMRVHPDARLRGIGQFLLRMCERTAARTHSLLRCDMGEDNEALPFFLRWGYRQVDSIDLYNSGMKDILLVKVL
jgi:GNAT superfamily N-acetyltransferase